MKSLIRVPYVLLVITLAAWLSFALQPSIDQGSVHRIYQREDDDLSTHRLYKRLTDIDDQFVSTKGKKQDQGTKDAPVDGADGKPHAGPFVEAVENLQSKKEPKTDSASKDKSTVEDGVMNDPHRALPKKGTTGTEGGVTEKSRDKEVHENETGRKKIQKPESPKDADAVSHKEDDSTMSTKKSDKQKSLKGADRPAGKTSKTDEQDDNPRGAMSIEVCSVAQS